MSDVYLKPTLIPSQRPNTNPRYRNFCQAHFTAGDEEQFRLHCNSTPFLPKNIPSHAQTVWNFSLSELYKQPTTNTMMNTFRYLFYKFKKGIFIQIRNQKLAVFLPFSNAHYVNEWSHLITPTADLRASSTVLPQHMWYANNYLIRYENPVNEGDMGHAQLKNMLEELCAIYEVPDTEFFINRRDFPLLKKDGTEPYEAIYGDNTPLVSHLYAHYLPIFSMVEKAGYADVAFPTPEDWSRIRALETQPKYFASTKRTLAPFMDDFNQNWATKKPLVVFRGSATGAGVASNNLRIRICELTVDDPRFDTGITDNSVRYQIHKGSLIRQAFLKREHRAQYMSLTQQSQYKYILHIAGHVQAYRLSAELATGSALLLVESEYKMWFEQKLVPWEHYIPVKADLSDLFDQVSWCLQHDEECRIIAQNARAFYTKYLSKHGCLNYIYELICHYRRECVPKLYIYPVISPTQKYLLDLEQMWANVRCTASPTFCKDSPILSTKRCYINIQKYNEEQPQLARVVFSNRNTRIEQISANCIRKTGTSSLLHEGLIGQTCVNALLKRIPNFVYTFDYSKTTNTLHIEYIHGMTLQQYLSSNAFLFEDWLCIVKQLTLAFSVAQRMYKFVHHDACPWNIVLHEEKTYRTFDYMIEGTRIVRVHSRLTPILIDYGRSSACIDQGTVQAWSGYEPFQDSLCLLITSAYIVLRQQKLTALQQSILLDVFNNTFKGYDLYYRHCPRFADLIYWLEYAHKYSHIVFAPKGPILSQSPLILFDNITIQKTHYCQFEATSEYEYTHLGKVSSIYSVPSMPNPLFLRYVVLRLWLLVEKNTPAERYLMSLYTPQAIDINAYKPWSISSPFMDLHVQDMLNLLEYCAGPFALDACEKHYISTLREKLFNK